MSGTVLSAENTAVTETIQCSYFQGLDNLVRARHRINMYVNRTRW